VECPFCGSSLYLDPGSAVHHELLLPSLERSELGSRIETFLSQRETPGRPRLLRARLLFVPYWVIPVPGGSRTAPAAVLGTLPLARYEFVSGEVRGFDRELARGGEVVPATVLVESLLPAGERGPGSVPKGTRLVHVPFWLVEYRLSRGLYRALVGAVGGQVLHGALPVSSEAWLDFAYSSLLALLLFGLVVGFHQLFGGDTRGWLWLAAGAPATWTGVWILGRTSAE